MLPMLAAALAKIHEIPVLPRLHAANHKPKGTWSTMWSILTFHANPRRSIGVEEERN
jgi:hypothetical protein